MNEALSTWVIIVVPGILAGLSLTNRLRLLYSFPAYLFLAWWYDVAVVIKPQLWENYTLWAIKQSLVEVARAVVVAEFTVRVFLTWPRIWRPIAAVALLPVSLAAWGACQLLWASLGLVARPYDGRAHSILVADLTPVVTVSLLAAITVVLLIGARTKLRIDPYLWRVVGGLALYVTLYGSLIQYLPSELRHYIGDYAPVGYSLICLWWLYAAWNPGSLSEPAKETVTHGPPRSGPSFDDAGRRRVIGAKHS